jgi:hypothetical protein
MTRKSDQIESPLADVTRPGFGDAASLEAWQAECSAAVARQLVPFAVAPSCSVPTPRGRIAAGGEVTVADFGGLPSTLDVLVARGVVLRASPEQMDAARCPTAARFVVAAGGSVCTSQRGIVTAGGRVAAADFAGGQADVDDLVRRGAVVDRGAAK